MNDRTRHLQKWYPRIIANELPKEYEDYFLKPMPEFTGQIFTTPLIMRESYINRGMYAYVAWNWVKPLAAWIGKRKVLEVMAGAGWLAMALRNLGVNIIATDDYSWAMPKELLKQAKRLKMYPLPKGLIPARMWHRRVTDVEKLGALQAIKKYGSEVDILIMSWPPYNSSIAYYAAKWLYKLNPKAIIVYIGEAMGGCTANDKFFKHFDAIYDDKEFDAVQANFRSWLAIHDRAYIGRFDPNGRND